MRGANKIQITLWNIQLLPSWKNEMEQKNCIVSEGIQRSKEAYLSVAWNLRHILQKTDYINHENMYKTFNIIHVYTLVTKATCMIFSTLNITLTEEHSELLHWKLRNLLLIPQIPTLKLASSIIIALSKKCVKYSRNI